MSGIGEFHPEMVIPAGATGVPGSMAVVLFMIAGITGFFATAGAAGADIASSNRDAKDVQLGGLAGVAGVTVFTGCAALLIVAGAYGGGIVKGDAGTSPRGSWN